jgi:hypothetical protein
MFSSTGGGGASQGQASGTPPEGPGLRPNANHVFGDVFEDVSLFLLLLRVRHRGRYTRNID